MRTTGVSQRKKLEQKLKTLSNEIGNTGLYDVRRVYAKPGVKIFAKIEWAQLGGSVKARPAFNIIKTAIKKGHLGHGKALLDATSGNTGIAYASIAKNLGIPVVLCLPQNASDERKNILTALGAELVLTSELEGTDGAQEVAKSLYQQNPDKFFYASQYTNEANWQAHYNGTAREIWNQTNGQVTHFVAGLGTTGTFVGTSKKLKEYNTAIQAVALQPQSAMHGLEGWKHLETAITPEIYDHKAADQMLEVDTESAYRVMKALKRRSDLAVSPSAAANLIGAIKVAEHIDKGVIVTSFADNGDKYSEVYKRLGL